MTPEKALQLVDDILAGKEVKPSRGADTVASFQGHVAGTRGLHRRQRRRGHLGGRRQLGGPGDREAAGLEGAGQMTDLTPVLSATWGLERSWNLDTYVANGGYEGATKALRDGPGRRHSGRQGLWLARPRRRRLPHRNEVGLPARPGRRPPLPGGQCRRVRARHLQGHPDHDGVAPRADRGRSIITAFAIGCEHAFIYVRGEVVHVYRRADEGGSGGVRRRLARQEHPRAPTSTSTSPSTRARAPTSAARRPRCSTRSRADAASPA